MRSFLGFVVFTAALIAVLAAFVVPPLVAPLVASAVQDASPFGDRPLDVEVDVDALGLLRGFVSEVRISGSDLAADGVAIGSLDVTIQAVETDADHDFAAISGGFDRLVVPRTGGTPINVRTLTLSGSSSELRAQATLDASQALLLIGESLAEAGVAADDAELVDGGVAVTLLGQRLEVALIVVDGAVVAPLPGRSPIVLLEPDGGDPWRVLAVEVDPTSLQVTASVDAGRLFAQR